MECGNGMVDNKGTNANDVGIQIVDNEVGQVTKKISVSASCSESNQLSSSNIEQKELENLSCTNQLSNFTSSASPDTVTWTPPPDKPAEISNQILTRRKSVPISDYPKSESRPVDPHDPNNSTSGEAEEDQDEEEKEKQKEKVIKIKTFAIIEFIAIVSAMGLLILSLRVNKLKNHVIWDLKLWKWCALVLVIFFGRLVSKWFMNALLFFIGRNFLLKRKLLYFVHGLRTVITVFIWLILLLLARFLLFPNGVKRSKETTEILNYITRALASSLVGAALWMVKTFSVKLLAISFLSKRFFDPIQETIFHQYLIQTLSGPPFMEIAEQNGSTDTVASVQVENEKQEVHVIDMGNLRKIKKKRVSTWAMKVLIDTVRFTRLSITSNQPDEQEDCYKDVEIESELQAEYAADQIFANVAKPGCDYIDKEQLCQFFIIEEVRLVLALFEGAEDTGKIHESDFKKWVVKVYNERISLSHFIKNSKAATQELDRLFTGIVIVVIIILWLILMKILTSKALVFVISQLVLVAFMFGNTAKNIFEAVIFLFLMHPFDVGDRCVIDGVQMIVEDIRILTTTFVRYDNEKVFYPNSVLATKPVVNFYRSTGYMRDSVEFCIDVSTSIQTIETLNSRIKDYLKSRPEHWRPQHSVVVKEIEDANKMKMALHVVHTINFRNYEEKNNRRSKLVLQLKQIFDELGISKYRVLPQEVPVSSAASAAPSAD